MGDDFNAELERLRSQRRNAPVPLPSFSKADLPAAGSYPCCMIFVPNEAGGATPAFSDGTNWRRVADRIIVS
ncbi:hypothetical protein CRT60_00300 [Azospirillum palustre]|uniref:Uncharacterized protein n=2 Tax=Azospirillum palustre TaxID=2044885 RepID=A0A2B8BPI6_9PROT|nr:hypothetical protein CRT60_00300 [Azospirillum palustre]